MCTRATCDSCNKITWRGCGAHIEQVLRGVPRQERCSCPTPQPRGMLKSLWSMLRGGE